MFSALYLKAKQWETGSNMSFGALVAIPLENSQSEPIAPGYLFLHDFKNIFASFKTLAFPPHYFHWNFSWVCICSVLFS